MEEDCRNRILSEEYAAFIIEYHDDLPDLSAKYDFCFEIINATHAIAYTPIATLPNNLIHIFGYSIYPSVFGLLDITSVEASGIVRLRNIPALNLRGQGVLIGIIDTGIDYTHDAFKYADGTSRILSLWDQTIESENSRPEGFNYGTEYTQFQLNLALASANPLTVVPSVDENGHGTFLAGIAAGSRSEENNFTGVVPDAEIVVVKLKPAKQFTRDFFMIPEGATCYQENDIMLGVKYLTNISRKSVRPISICIGFGTSQGAHDERGVLSSYLSDIADENGVAVVIAAGNEGNRGHHYYGLVDKVSGYDTVELKVGPNETGFSMELWGDAPSTFSIDILSPTGEYIPRVPARIGETREIQFIFEDTKIYLDYQVIETQTGDELILMRFRNPTEGIWRFRVYSSSDLDLNFNIWLPMNQFISDTTYFTEPDPEYTLTSPGNTFIPIVVTAYDHTNDSLYINASRGYTRTQQISPSLAAPGVNIIGPTINNGYKLSTGTSIAAAHTAGVSAMLLEWGIARGNYTQLDSVEIKNFLIRGARRDPNVTYPNKEWGYGILDIYGSFASLRGEII